MYFQVLSSGSKQNCFFIRSNKAAILIDCGISFLKVKHYLSLAGYKATDIQALFITHEHADHIRGVSSIVRNLGIPVYIHPKCLDALDFPVKTARSVNSEERIKIADITITPVNVSHDAAHTFGYSVRAGRHTLFLASDVGIINKDLVNTARKAEIIAIESNYDDDMLAGSTYPDYLKARISGPQGHLSNSECSLFLQSSITNKTSDVFFLHISENNNSPDRITKMVQQTLLPAYPHVRFHLTNRNKPSEPLKLD